MSSFFFFLLLVLVAGLLIFILFPKKNRSSQLNSNPNFSSLQTSLPLAKSTLVAASLSTIPGFGHFYLGQNAKGALLLLSSLPFYSLPVTIPLAIFDASVMAKRSKRGCLLEPWEWFWSPPVDSGLKFIEFVLIRRTEEPIGTEKRIVSNQSKEKITRNMELTHEWTFNYTIQREVSRKITDVNSIQMRDGASRSRTIEDIFREQFSSSKGERKTYRETVAVEIPGNKAIEIRLLWKNNVEIGSILLRDSKQNEYILPYRAVVGVTFDVETVEVPF